MPKRTANQITTDMIGDFTDGMESLQNKNRNDMQQIQSDTEEHVLAMVVTLADTVATLARRVSALEAKQEASDRE